MRALTVRQPYATRIVSGIKKVENRSRNTNLRGLLLIHAGAMVHDRFPEKEWPQIARLPRAAVVGSVQLVGSHRASQEIGACCGVEAGAEWPEPGSDFAVFHWLMADACEFVTPIRNVKGSLGFWEPGPSVAHLASIADVSQVRL